ncbi:MAG: ATP-binding protein [Nitrospira sp.]|nr:PAS domain S-box protein [Candidatus Manganitrophaceae bacterium]HIL34575.1 PAS domain S-box protein [Candidatus Manganitrophaceae bacterium]
MVLRKRGVLEIRFFVLFLSIFLFSLLILLLVYFSLELRTTLRALDKNEQERLKLFGESVRASLRRERTEEEPDVFFLHSLAVEKNIVQLTLIDPDGMIVADSRREVSGKEMIPEEHQNKYWKTALEGGIVLEPFLHEKKEKRGRILWVPLENKQLLRLVIPIRLDREKKSNGLLLFIKVFGVLGGAVLVYSLFHFLWRSPVPRRMDSARATGETGFVIDTFEGLIRQLKQKEESLELEKGKAEEYAESVESYNENILQSVTSGVLTFNREKKIMTFNSSASTILNVPSETVMGKTYLELFGENQKITSFLEETLKKEREIHREECEVERLDKDRIWLGLNTSLIRDRKDKIIGATLVFTDLTEMKMLQEQIELKKRLAVMGEMSAWIAHEFRNYMGTILGFSRLLSKKFAPADAKQEMIKAITDELSSMERLITELLSYGKRAEIHPVPVAMIPLLKDLMQEFIVTRKYPNIRWVTSFPMVVPEIRLDPVLINRAFSNLLRNALEALEADGEIRLRVLTRPAGMIQVEFSDNGPGIPKENLDKIFLPFFTTKEKGTGVGLSLVHKIILSHGGHLSVGSMEGKGTTFRVILPLQPRSDFQV